MDGIAIEDHSVKKRLRQSFNDLRVQFFNFKIS